MKRYTLAAVAALLVLVPWHETVRAGAPLYSVQNLGSFNGVVPTISGINASGQVIGNVNGAQAVRYTPGQGWAALPGLGTSFSFAMGINGSGDVTGYYINSVGQFRAFRYRDGFPVDDIAPLAGGSMTFGFGIDDADDVVGVSFGSTSVPFRAPLGLAAEALPTLDGGSGSACGINASGQIAGTSNVASGAQHGVRIDSGAAFPIDIASPDGPSFNVNACAIDAAGRVGGQLDRASGQTHAFRFTDSGVEDLDAFGSALSNVESISQGVSVGWYTVAGGDTRAFAHRDADGSFDLNTRIDEPGWVLRTAKGVNINGQIAGEGTFNGAPAVYMLTPSAADTTPPVIAPHADETAEATGPSGAIVTYSAPATTDDVDGSGTASCSPVSGSTFALGTTTVTCTASDAAGNAATPTTFKIVVRDTTAPVIAAHGDATAEATGPNGAAVTYSAPATSDAVDGSGTAACSPASGSTFALGTTTVTCTAGDAAGNAAAPTTFKVTVVDTTAPVITALSANPSAIWPANGKMVAVSLSASASDAVDPSPVCTLTSVTGAPASDIVITGPLSASVRASKDEWGWSTRTYVFQVACSDGAGNTSQGAVSVSVSKDAPSVTYVLNRRLNQWLVHGFGHRR